VSKIQKKTLENCLIHEKIYFVLRKVCIRLGSWWEKSLPSLWSLVGLWGWTTTLELRNGPDSNKRQQWGILGNERKLDPAKPYVWLTIYNCKALYLNLNNDLI